MNTFTFFNEPLLLGLFKQTVIIQLLNERVIRYNTLVVVSPDTFLNILQL